MRSNSWLSASESERRARRKLPSVVVVGGLAVVLAEGLTPLTSDVSLISRTLLGAAVIGVIGSLLAHRAAALAAIWTVPPILALLPARGALLSLRAETEAALQALHGRARQTRSPSASVSHPNP